MNTNGKVSEAQGAETQELPKVPTIQEVRNFLKKDLGMCITMLDAIYKDPNTLNSLADFLHGRFINQREAEAIKNQQKLF